MKQALHKTGASALISLTLIALSPVLASYQALAGGMAAKANTNFKPAGASMPMIDVGQQVANILPDFSLKLEHLPLGRNSSLVPTRASARAAISATAPAQPQAALAASLIAVPRAMPTSATPALAAEKPTPADSDSSPSWQERIALMGEKVRAIASYQEPVAQAAGMNAFFEQSRIPAADGLALFSGQLAGLPGKLALLRLGGKGQNVQKQSPNAPPTPSQGPNLPPPAQLKPMIIAGGFFATVYFVFSGQIFAGAIMTAASLIALFGLEKIENWLAKAPAEPQADRPAAAQTSSADSEKIQAELQHLAATDPAAAVAAAAAIVKEGKEQNFGVLLRVMSILNQAPAGVSVPAYIKMALSKDSWIRREAARNLGLNADKSKEWLDTAKSVLTYSYAKDPDPSVRNMADWALRNLGVDHEGPIGPLP
ncbi:MAG: hypothetical protein WC881_09450 [Elusimicrobiota bacterium]|jgi:hypothetical protein